MSKERQRRRAAQEAERAKARAKAARQAERREKVARLTPSVPEVPKRQPVYRQRRFAPLPTRMKVALALFWVACAALILYLAPTWTGRFGLLVVLTMTIPLIVVIVRNPSRRYR